MFDKRVIIEHSHVWVSGIVDEANRWLQELQDAEGDDTLKIIGGCPVRYIREVKEDGTDVLIGDIMLERCETMELAGSKGVNWKDAPRLLEINNQRKNGDPEIIWSVGCKSDVFRLITTLVHQTETDFLKTSHAGQGIMSSAFNAVLQQWAIPRMGLRRMIALTWPTNRSSQRVMEKNGFILREVVEEYVEAKGKIRDIWVFDLSVTV